MDKYLGKRLDGRYEMRELIGVGGMAYVYKAYDAVDDRIVAVKILKDEYLNSDEFVRRFRNESKAIAILNHPNIVKVLDVGFGERLQYIVMEYIDGITLKEYLDQRKDIRWKEAVHFTVQILRALQHAHDKGIVHRDIKPQNIMLLSDGTIKVTDFGIARLTRSDMKATVEGNKAIGSVHYISPEQARGEITDEKTDLYAVGIMLYETLTGRLPFEADNAVSVAIMQMQSEAKAPHLINAEIPEGLEQITLKAMQKDTTKRYQSAAEMLNDFEEFKKNPSIKFEYTYMVDETPTRYVDAITRVRGESPEQVNKPQKEDPAQAKKKAEENKKTAKNVSVIVILCLVTALTIVGIVFGLIALFNSLKKPADEVKVEKFIGMMYYTEIEGVSKYASNYDLKIKWEDANNPEFKKGEVFKQEPAAGKTVKKGATVTLYINSATPKDISLDVRAEIEGAHKDDVRKLLQDTGFVVNEIASSSDNIPVNHVISININKGQSYPYGTKVSMVVSTGPSTLEPIEFPDMIIGETQETAASILTNRGFVGTITYSAENYADAAYAKKGTVMGVKIDNVLMEELPKEISPDVSITLVVSNGLKDVTVELEWPKDKNGKNVNKALNISVVVNGTPNDALTEKYNNPSYNPSYTTNKMSFTLTSHPGEAEYSVGISVKEASSDTYTEYARVRINPVEGTWTMEGDYQHLPGITPAQATIPADVIGYILSYSDLTSKLTGFNVSVVDELGNAVTSGDSLYVDRIVCNGADVNGGDKVVADARLTVYVTNHSADTGRVIPNDIFDTDMSYSDLVSALGSFAITVKDNAGSVVSAADSLRVSKIVWMGSEVQAGESLPVGAEIEVFVTEIKMMVPADLVGQSKETAVTRLQELGFVVEIRGSNGEENPTGSVLQITYQGDIASGQLYPIGTTLLITVSDNV